MKLEKRKTLFRSLSEAKKTVIFEKKKNLRHQKRKITGQFYLRR